MAIFTLPISRVADSNFRVGSGYKLYFYEAGTTTAKDVYTDNTYATPLSNPVVADSAGRFSVIWTSGDYKVRLTDASDVLIWEVDDYNNDANTSKFAQGVLSAAGSAADVITANLPTTPGTLTDQLQVVVELQHGANTTATPTFSLNGLPDKTIKRDNNQSLLVGDTGGSGYKLYLSYSASNDVWILLNPKNPAVRSVNVSQHGWLPLQWVDGLKVSNNSTDAEHDIDITAGQIADDTQTYLMNCQAITKAIDATWATGAGGLSNQDNSGVVQNNTWYGVWAQHKSTDPYTAATSNAIFATTQANALGDTVAAAAGYDIVRLIGAVLTDGSANIIAFVDGGNGWNVWDAQIDTGASASATAVPTTVAAPPFMPAIMRYHVANTSASTRTTGGILTQIGQTDTNPDSLSESDIFLPADGVTGLRTYGHIIKTLKTDASSQIRHREYNDVSISSLDINLVTQGWIFDPTVTDLV